MMFSFGEKMKKLIYSIKIYTGGKFWAWFFFGTELTFSLKVVSVYLHIFFQIWRIFQNHRSRLSSRYFQLAGYPTKYWCCVHFCLWWQNLFFQGSFLPTLWWWFSDRCSPTTHQFLLVCKLPRLMVVWSRKY